MKIIKKKNEWYERLVLELNNVCLESDIFSYYTLLNICYPITEYIVKNIGIGGRKKEQNLNAKFNCRLTYVYNNEFYLNDLKHMNDIKNFNKWENILDTDWSMLSEKLYVNTHKLINLFETSNVLRRESILETFNSIYASEEFNYSINLMEQLKKTASISSEISKGILSNHLCAVSSALNSLISSAEENNRNQNI